MYRLRMLLTWPWRRRGNWSKPCGCSFKATAFGWLHIECLNHYLD